MAITKVYLLNVPLENDYKNSLYFANASAQHSYFASKVVKSYDSGSNGFTYQRKDHTIRVPEEYDNLFNCNYVMYQNTTYSNKWFYAFITDMQYVSDGVTKIEIETDVIQTWLFDYTVKASFVEREHVSDDTWGAHTVPEGLEMGEYISNGFVRTNELEDYAYIMTASEAAPGDQTSKTFFIGAMAYPGAAYYYESVAMLQYKIDSYEVDDAVNSVYLVPKAIVDNKPEGGNGQWSGQPGTTTKFNKTIDKQTTLNGYTPRNKKLLCYPYNCLVLDNNNGSSNVLMYEQFSTNDCQFEIAAVPTVGGSIKCAPLNYKGVERYQQEGLMAGKFPTGGWVSDQYTNWLTQNAVNIGIGVVSSVAQLVGGAAAVATGAGAAVGAGAIASGVTGIANTVGQVYQHSMIPDTAKGNTNGGDINTTYKMNKFYFIKLSIKAEYARIIDGFFDMFGYKVNQVKVPNSNHRARWWYTKTIDVNIDGAIPNKDMQIIKNAYNSGITFWRNASEIQNYSLSNGIV